MVVLEHQQPFHPVSVRLVEGAVEELGAELVEAMPGHLVGGRRHQQVPSDLHHAHQAAECGCELEEMLGPAVDDHVERLVPAVRRRPVQVVHDARALVVGVVELIQLQRAERAEKLIRDVRAATDRSGPVPLLRALDEPSRRELPGQPQRARRQGPTADRNVRSKLTPDDLASIKKRAADLPIAIDAARGLGRRVGHGAASYKAPPGTRRGWWGAGAAYRARLAAARRPMLAESSVASIPTRPSRTAACCRS